MIWKILMEKLTQKAKQKSSIFWKNLGLKTWLMAFAFTFFSRLTFSFPIEAKQEIWMIHQKIFFPLTFLGGNTQIRIFSHIFQWKNETAYGV